MGSQEISIFSLRAVNHHAWCFPDSKMLFLRKCEFPGEMPSVGSEMDAGRMSAFSALPAR